jgi:hypothetical protein
MKVYAHYVHGFLSLDLLGGVKQCRRPVLDSIALLKELI